MVKKLIAKTLRTTKLSNEQKNIMFVVFGKYYDNVSFSRFDEDLKQKDVVFLLLDKNTKEINGFSTIVKLNVNLGGKQVRGFFSGDTIVEEEYWGQGALGKAFLKYLFLEKVKAPHKELYWYLISKGYKSYLLMANNFDDYYPRFDKETPKEKKEIIDSFSESLFSNYDKASGLIPASSFEQEKDKLKEFISPINDDLKRKNPKIEHFHNLNSNWMDGDELACIAKMTFSMPFKYQIKLFSKMTKNFSQKIKVLSLP